MRSQVRYCPIARFSAALNPVISESLRVEKPRMWRLPFRVVALLARLVMAHPLSRPALRQLAAAVAVA